ncbi:MAG TPA: GNAT family protein [Ktedonobacterales bacterium]|jgi:RimJ/RimL family protein N-acetyltransferase|nr:GNAT family protein [Ktedonobacterales bacterium]
MTPGPAWVQPVTLMGTAVRLEPLGLQHADDLFAAAQDPDIWRYLPVDPSAAPAALRAWITAALDAQTAGGELPFAIRDRATGRALGSTRYLNISARDRGLEIGWTWLARPARRTTVNTECKYLLLRHAFETLRAVRVQLKTDRRNTVSQAAIERLGAVREGILRKHMLVANGYIRDTVMYSVTDDEWPGVKVRLQRMLVALPS